MDSFAPGVLGHCLIAGVSTSGAQDARHTAAHAFVQLLNILGLNGAKGVMQGLPKGVPGVEGPATQALANPERCSTGFKSGE